MQRGLVGARVFYSPNFPSVLKTGKGCEVGDEEVALAAGEARPQKEASSIATLSILALRAAGRGI
ncbi:hypothetical protein HNQ64_004534 [Prosthecobacter dejongeii]|uniref:Uncharacterized protein n=1 Tax=Prosthecobacter dejongeii TaxID=48465 RepID=A0A7W7YQ04_9BACT|nr:hypothetical protein [Prosthecobacter dejongeii]